MKKDDDGIGLTEEELNLWDSVTENDERWKSVNKTNKYINNNRINKISNVKYDGGGKGPAGKPAEESFSYINVGHVAGVDGNTAEKLKRGKIRPEATLDLHGMTQKNAFEELTNFIRACHTRGKRCALVITGKGLRKDGSVGVLRENVPKWLNAPHLRPMILAFTHAQPKDGGEGALYVLLKKL